MYRNTCENLYISSYVLTVRQEVSERFISYSLQWKKTNKHVLKSLLYLADKAVTETDGWGNHLVIPRQCTVPRNLRCKWPVLTERLILTFIVGIQSIVLVHRHSPYQMLGYQMPARFAEKLQIASVQLSLWPPAGQESYKTKTQFLEGRDVMVRNDPEVVNKGKIT